VVVPIEISDSLAITRILQKHFGDHIVQTLTIGVEMFSSHYNSESVTIVYRDELTYISPSLKVSGYDTPIITNPYVTATKLTEKLALYGFNASEAKLLLGIIPFANTKNNLSHFF
jgi:hypothetical protein